MVTLRRDAYPRSTQPEPIWDADGASPTTFSFALPGIAWLHDLIAQGTEVVWASTWLDYANTYLSPALGLPNLPVVVSEADWAAICDGNLTGSQIAHRYDGRPVLFVSDMLPPKGLQHLEQLRHPHDRALTHFQHVPWSATISHRDIATMNRWLSLTSTPDGQSELRREYQHRPNRSRR